MITTTMDLFDNPVGCRTSLAKSPAFRCFSAEVVQKLKFPNNFIIQLGDFHISNTDGKTRFSFVIPSLPKRYSLAEEADKLISIQDA